MKLDLRRPTLVLAGAWNPAIFQPGWIARHIFEVPAGEEITVRVAQLALDDQPKQVLYIEDVGFSVSQHRLEMFAAEANESAFDKVESAVKKVVQVLPHTPVLGCGINFYFLEEQPRPDLLGKIKSADALETRFDVIREDIASTIHLEHLIQLLLTRKRGRDVVSFDFNFHRNVVDADKLPEVIGGQIQSRKDQAMAIMKEVYALSTYEVLVHDFSASG